MAGYTTAMTGSFRAEIPSSWHCFLASASVTGNISASSFQLSGLASGVVLGLAVGMAVTASGGQFPATTIASFPSTTAVNLAASATASGGSITVSATADVFKIALGVAAPAGTYNAATLNYSGFTADELPNGSGYTTGGSGMTNNISPQSSGTGNAWWQWSNNPSWTSATFSTAGALIYNTSLRNPVSGRVVSVHSFGGTQTVTAGTFTLLQPVNASGTALLQIN